MGGIPRPGPGGIPPGKPGNPAGGKLGGPPMAVWSIGFACPTASYDDVMESITLCAFS
jgi:hypothetical protein